MTINHSDLLRMAEETHGDYTSGHASRRRPLIDQVYALCVLFNLAAGKGTSEMVAYAVQIHGAMMILDTQVMMKKAAA